jgi:hypothetical protein
MMYITLRTAGINLIPKLSATRHFLFVHENIFHYKPDLVFQFRFKVKFRLPFALWFGHGKTTKIKYNLRFPNPSPNNKLVEF